MAVAQEAQFELLRRQFAQVVSIRELAFPPGAILKRASIQLAMARTMFSSEASLSNKIYSYKVFKKVLDLISEACIDAEDDEILDELASCLEPMLSAQLPSAMSTSLTAASRPGLTPVSYTPPQALDRPLTRCAIDIQEAVGLLSASGTTGHRTWEAALHLSHFICRQSSTPASGSVLGATVLELGAGRGLLSYVCADVCGARQVIPTDGAEELVRTLQSQRPGQAQQSTADGTARCLWDPYLLDWELETGPGSLEALLSGDVICDGKIDVVLGADITFDERILKPLATTLVAVLRMNPAAEAFIAATVRNETTVRAFESICRNEGLHIQEVPFDCPESSLEQTGFFHSHQVPILIYRIFTAQ